MEISAEKAKLMTNSANCIQKEIKIKGQKLGNHNKLQVPYFGAVVSYNGSKPEILSRATQATAAYEAEANLKRQHRPKQHICWIKGETMHGFPCHFHISACLWAFTAKLDKRMQAFEMRCY